MGNSYWQVTGLNMSHFASFSLVVLVSLQLAASAPFFDLKLPFLDVRREGKNIDDGYGAPSDGYGGPEDGYGAPGHQKPVFPDIFGIIGEKIGDILKPKQENNNTPYDCLSAPEEGYGVPQATAYEAPTQESTYEAPQADSYEAPQADSYEAPQA